MKIVLISTYELGRQPFGLASPAAWLRQRGHQVICADVAVGAFPQRSVAEAGMIAFYLPMHTATRMSAPLISRAHQLNPTARIVCYGLYAPLNEPYLRSLGVDDIIGGEFEAELANLADGTRRHRDLVSLDRLTFLTPDRSGLPGLSRYAALEWQGQRRRVGYTEASRGCRHLCRHCPVVPVYNGAFRIVQHDVIMADIRQQIAAGAQHITFGDPDFFNGPAHARRLIESLHQEFPELTYDATIKIEHLLQHADLLPVLKRTGCLFVTSAVESIDDDVLLKLEKGHSRADFLAVAGLFRDAGLTLAPTFIPFTPWTTLAGYRDLLATLADLDLIEHVSSVQLALRLLIPSRSRLLELAELRQVLGEFDEAALSWRWRHPNPAIDQLAGRLLQTVAREQANQRSRSEIFSTLWTEAFNERLPETYDLVSRAAIPYLTEPWYC